MAITDAQKVDLLYKKIGFGVAKTDTSAFKSPSNEANASPLLTRGDTIWQLSDQIPTTIPAANTAVVALYKDSLTSTIQATLDSTVSGTNRTWLTNLRDWIPPEFGADYQVKVYADTNGSTTPQTTGTQLFADGSGNNDAWYFDYAAGILNFPDTNVPSAVSGKRIFVSGARYIGFKGVATFSNVAFGNITITGNIAGNVVGNVLTTDQPYITSLGNLTSLNVIGNLSAGNLIVGNVDLSGLTSNVITANAANISGNAVARWFLGNAQGPTGNFTTSVTSTMFYGNITAQSITSPTGDLHISAATNDSNNIIRFDSVSAFDIPSGTTAQRPPTPDYGYVRYNTDLGTIEWWAGSSWVPGSNLIVSENITPDGASAVYTLGQTTTENAILVNINGTIQQAGAGAYSVAGNQITFAEVPLVTDIIEIRYIAGGVAALTTNFANIASNVVPSANVAYSLGSATNRWKDLWSSGNVVVGENLQQSGGTINSGYFYANVVADQNLFANTAFSTFICNASPHPGTIANLRFTLPSAAEDGREITLRIQGVPVTSLFVSNGAESIATGSTVYWIANNWATTGNVTAKFVYNSSITRWMRTL